MPAQPNIVSPLTGANDASLPYRDIEPVGAPDFYFVNNATFTFIHDRFGDESLHTDGLRCAINRQLDAGIGGLLIAGSLGAMQLLPDATYRDLVAASAEQAAGRIELLVGAGDAAFPRTRDRIAFLNNFPVNGVCRR